MTEAPTLDQLDAAIDAADNPNVVFNVGGAEVHATAIEKPTRKLASIRRIAAIDPIEGADRIVTVTVDGWKVVAAKDSGLKVGDLVVYFEIDSFLPVEDRYEFLRKTCFKTTKHLGDGFRLKTIRLRGQISQGLVLPVSEFPDLGTIFMEGDDATKILRVKKWEPPAIMTRGGYALRPWPHFIPKTDQERAQNLLGKIRQRWDEAFEITIKLDGSSMTVYRNELGEVSVCSRNIDLRTEEHDENNVFWKTAKVSGLIDWIKEYPFPIAIQGELMGPGIQGNREKLDTHKFFVYDIYDIHLRRYLRPPERVELGHATGLSKVTEHVPVIVENAPLDRIIDFARPDVMDQFLEFAEGHSLHNAKREGIVFKSLDSDLTFKVIANSYLLEEA